MPATDDAVVGEDTSLAQLLPSAKREKATGPPAFGGKTITFVGSVALLTNNILGPGIFSLPSMFQESGWLFPLLVLFILGAITSVSANLLMHAMRLVPGNGDFRCRVEYTDVARIMLPRAGYVALQLFFQLSMLAINCSNIVQTAQVADFLIADVCGRSCALRFGGAGDEYNSTWICADHTNCSGTDHDDDASACSTPFGDDVQVLSLGFVVVALLCIPLGYYNLDDNIVVQNVALVAMVVMLLGCFVLFGTVGSGEASDVIKIDFGRVPIIGSNFAPVVGILAFNFALTSSLPSWLNEKHESVNAMRCVNTSIGISVGTFFLLGLLGAAAFKPFYQSDADMLQMLQKVDNGFARFTVVAFPFASNLSSIPVFCILARYNLVQSGLFGHRTASFLAVVVPWLVCVPFYSGAGFDDIIGWSGLFLVPVVNFLAPPVFFACAVRNHSPVGAVTTPRNRQLTQQEGRRALRIAAAAFGATLAIVLFAIIWGIANGQDYS